MPRSHHPPHRTLRAATATILAGTTLAAAGCGGGAKAQPTPTAPTSAQLERSAAAERRLHIDEIVGEYISELHESPAAAGDPRATAATVGQLSTEAALVTADHRC